MTLLIADVGGTNTRVALAPHGTPIALRRFANNDYEGIEAVLRDYIGGTNTPISACAIAIAGPVDGTAGRLTNRDWHIDAKAVGQILRCNRVTLLNDLTALGFALARLPAAACAPVHEPATDISHNRQSLVIGIGTGFNLCPVITAPARPPACFVVEAGHTSLPCSVAKALPEPDAFPTTEDLFSGAGLAALHRLQHPGSRMNGEQIVKAHRSGTDALASETLLLFTGLLSRLCTELALQYMPLAGIFFAGGVARGVLSADMHPVLIRDHASHRKLGSQLSRIPMSIIEDDAAALYGCIAAAER